MSTRTGTLAGQAYYRQSYFSRFDVARNPYDPAMHMESSGERMCILAGVS